MLGAVDAVWAEHGVGVQLFLTVEEDELEPQLWYAVQLLKLRVQRGR
jgi:hypothetical protein